MTAVLEPPQCGTAEVCGRLSGIPPCCRRWFTDVWQSVLWADDDVARTAWRALREARYRDAVFTRTVTGNRSWGWGYIPCPGCRQCGARIQVLACDCFRRRQLWLPFAEDDGE